jgi:predicted nuclease of predicted toxin-antitoxin system
MIRVQDTELYGADDSTVLEWAAQQGRVVLTHDLDTMTKYAGERIEQELPMAGVILIRDTVPVSKVIDDLLVVLGASEADEWENRIDFLPL